METENNIENKILWSNKDNIDYYEHVPVERFRQYAVLGGFETGCDIDIIYDDYLASANSIMDVGAGYGRALQAILDRNYEGKLIAIERSNNFCRYLKKHFSSDTDIFHTDISDFQPITPVDIVLSLWSNISEWPKQEQVGILKKLSTFCIPGGFLILDTISHLIIPLNIKQCSGQSYSSESEYGNTYGYTPSPEEISLYSLKIGARCIRQIPYKTDTGRDRVIHIIKI